MKAAIIGGGAGGLICAVAAMQAAEQNNKQPTVTVFEAADRVGKKILATGNGRCNMFNTDSEPFYFSCNKFHSYAIKKYDAASHTDFFNSLGLYTRTDEEGRVYPLSNQASTVLDCLRNECGRLGVIFRTGCRITDIKKAGNGFILNNDMQFDRVVLACGGAAAVRQFNGYELLKSLGHKVTEVTPSLTKLNTADTKDVKQLQGIRHKAKLTLSKGSRFVTEERGEILFAKYGISGIAVMQLSAFITRQKGNDWTVTADFIPDMTHSFVISAIKKMQNHNPAGQIENLLMGFMPKKLGEVIVKSVGIDPARQIGSLSEKETEAIVKKAKKYAFSISSVRPFEDAQVTSGGADTDYFNSETMESKLHKGLYCIGELLDVDGLCGGYNLMWAWSSGRLCGENLIK